LLLQRVVVDIELDSAGRLRPRAGATWRSEPARGEASIHRQLARLTDAPEARITAFASIHGLLRRHRRGVLGSPGPSSAAITIVMGQEALDDSARVQDWFERGAHGAPPIGTEDTVAQVMLLATLPEWVFETFDRFIAGREVAAPTPPSDVFATALPIAVATGKVAPSLLANPGSIRNLDPARIRRAFQINEWVARVTGGQEDVPEPLAAIGGLDAFLRQLIATIPDAFVRPGPLGGPDARVAAYLDEMATETVADWRTAARDIRARVRGMDLIRGALQSEGISRVTKHELLGLYSDLSDYRPPIELAAADIADRVRPLLASSIESELVGLDSWPIRRGGLAGLYPRALLAAWTELTEAAPPIACSTPGCLGVAPPTRNRLYCDRCRAERRRASVQETRARSSASPRSAH